MSLYILNKNQEVIRVIPTKGIHSLVQEEEINKADYLRAEIDMETWQSPDDWIRLEGESFYMAVRDLYDRSDVHVYKITIQRELVDRIELTGVNFAYDELKAKERIKSFHMDDVSLSFAMYWLFEQGNWEIGTLDSGFPKINLNVNYVSHLEALKLLIEQTGGEVRFRAKMENGRITNRVIDFVKDLSYFKGRRFALGSNLMDVIKEEDNSNLYTAMIGTGNNIPIDEDDPDAGESPLTFKDVEWRVSQGDPVDKPLGVEYLEFPEATRNYGYADGSPRMGYVNFSGESNPENVLIMTYNELMEASRPKIQFSASVNTVGEDMELGETVAIVKPGTDFRYKTRIFKIHRDYLDNNRTEVEFGDRLILSAAERMKTIKDDIKDEVKDEIHDGSSSDQEHLDLSEIYNRLRLIEDDIDLLDYEYTANEVFRMYAWNFQNEKNRLIWEINDSVNHEGMDTQSSMIYADKIIPFRNSSGESIGDLGHWDQGYIDHLNIYNTVEEVEGGENRHNILVGIDNAYTGVDGGGKFDGYIHFNNKTGVHAPLLEIDRLFINKSEEFKEVYDPEIHGDENHRSYIDVAYEVDQEVRLNPEGETTLVDGLAVSIIHPRNLSGTHYLYGADGNIYRSNMSRPPRSWGLYNPTK